MPLNPTDPSECFEHSQFGVGPFGVPTCPPHPTDQGYGGIPYGLGPVGGGAAVAAPAPAYVLTGGYGSDPYGLGPYGSPVQIRVPFAPGGGYGGSPYGTSGYGSLTDPDLQPPFLTSAISLDGFRVEVFFSEDVVVDAGLLDPTSYSFVGFLGGAPVTAELVEVGVAGSQPDTASSVIVSHTGTTLGGIYDLTVTNVIDVVGNKIEDAGLDGGGDPLNETRFLALGEPPGFTVTHVQEREVLVDFDRDMLPESDFAGIEETAAYDFATSYPVDPYAFDVEHPYSGDASHVLLNTYGLTEAQYSLNISPATAIEYDGSILPSEATTFSGVEVGEGFSVIEGGRLILSKNPGNPYGWNFADITGKMTVDSTYRVDVVFEAYTPTVSFPPDTIFGDFFISDGDTRVQVVLFRDAGVYRMAVVSGGYSSSFDALWFDPAGPTKISLVRNQRADTYTFLFNDVPQLTAAIASFTGPSGDLPGVQFLFLSPQDVEEFALISVDITASSTVYSAAWNFLHNQSATFQGNAFPGFVNDTFLTERGPLVKGWGDGQAATVNDVVVYVNGTAVEVSEVNPYLGRVTVATPIPLMPVGVLSVEVDYTWFPNPLMEAGTLNTDGAVLNKWDIPRGRNTTSINLCPDPDLVAQGFDPNTWIGGQDTSRFAFSLVLGPVDRPYPQRTAHRYRGLEKAYTASLNSPTTLLLNQNPHAIAVDTYEARPEAYLVAYEGRVSPLVDTPAWELEGQDTGEANDLTGLYRLADEVSGELETGGEPGYYHQAVDLSFPHLVTAIARYYVTDYDLDGVFTGVGFGVHDNRRLFLVGNLLINDVQHVGILLDPARPDAESAWEVGPTVEITVLDATTFSIPTSLFPVSVEEGDRLQVFSGSQTGVYVMDSYVNQSDGTTTVTLDGSTPFPANPAFFGNDKADAVFEILWQDTPSTYRFVTYPDQGKAELTVSGEITTTVFSTDRIREFSLPADSTLLFDLEGKGQVFWGSLSRNATNETYWSFFRYALTPEQTVFTSRGVVVSSEMDDLPQDDPNSEWDVTQGFGFSEVDGTGLRVLLKSAEAAAGADLTFGYRRIEPFLTPGNNIDVDVKLLVDSGNLGYGDAVVRINDGSREVRFANLLYLEPSGSLGRRLISQPWVSLSGYLTPAQQGWEATSGNSLTVSSKERLLTLTQELGSEGTFYRDLDLIGMDFTDEGGRTIEARFAVESYQADSGTGATGIIFGGEAGTTVQPYTVGVTLLAPVGATPARVALTSDGTPLQEYDFDWTDGEPHTYRLRFDGSTVRLLVDDVLQTPIVNTSLFDASTENTMVFFGTFGTATSSTVHWRWVSAVAEPPSNARRTLGVWKGGDLDDITSWAIPRTDGTAFANSSPSAVVEEMDWRNELEVRLHLDAGWGLVLYRPDLPLPPYATNDFTTEITQPDNGWVTVEYARLPRASETFGFVAFGALDTEAVTQQRWDHVRYRIYNHPDKDLRSPRGMVLNRSNMIHSGELLKDRTPEQAELVSLDERTITLAPVHVTAKSVFKVVETSTSDVFAPDEFRFEPENQLIILSRDLSESRAAVTVVFAPGNPVTDTYLENQPFEESCTILYEGTPPVPKSQAEGTTRIESFGSRINDPNDNLGDPDFILNDPYRFVEFEDSESSLYECLEFYELKDGGVENLLTSACDSTSAGGEGPQEIGFSGLLFTEQVVSPGGILGQNPFNTFNVLHFSGGSTNTGGVLQQDPSVFVMFPNYLPPGATPPAPGSLALNGEIKITLTLTSVLTDSVLGTEALLEEDASLSPTADNVPPAYSNDPDNVPDGTPGANAGGAALAVMETVGDYTRLGPWGGIETLEPNSLLYGVSASQPSGVPPSGAGFVLAGGAPLPSGSVSVLNLEAAN